MSSMPSLSQRIPKLQPEALRSKGHCIYTELEVSKDRKCSGPNPNPKPKTAINPKL